MKHILLGKLDVSRIGLGAMSMSGYSDFQTRAATRVDSHHPSGVGAGRHPPRHRVYGGELVARGLMG